MLKIYNTSRNYETLLTNFLNDLYGFNLTYGQYVAFDSTCSEIHCCWSVTPWTRSIYIAPDVHPISSNYLAAYAYSYNYSATFFTSKYTPSAEITAPGEYIYTAGIPTLFDTSTATTFTAVISNFIEYGETVDSTCGGVNILDSLLVSIRGSDTLYTLFYRQVSGAKMDSLSPTLCNEPLNRPDSIPPNDTNPCLTQLLTDASYNAQNAYNQYIDSITDAFRANYISHCMNIDDSFHLNMPFDEYHYTLYYYDQAENLVKTIPPQGVHPITNPDSLTDITNYRAGSESRPIYPQDSLGSRYWFNTLNSPIQQQTPDGDTARFWYDRLGRLVLSQNAVQKPYLYSYTLYDPIGRIVEVGQQNTITYSYGYNPITHAFGWMINPPLSISAVETLARNDASLSAFINTPGAHTQITHTFYDTVAVKHIPLIQTNLRKRISTITYTEVQKPVDTSYDNAIHYTYDIEGNVQSMVMEDRNDSALSQMYKRADYFYDLVSGKVNQLDYQRNQPDFFMQAYEYDADNRITDVQTSSDSINWTEEANYQYYSHGPLAREVIGRRQVQGVDYAYTINGWIKGINSSLGANMQNGSTYDMGHDGDVHGDNPTIGRDAYGFTLNYFNGDYRPIGGKTFEATALQDTGLYNGNIAGATYTIQHLLPKTMGWIYHYDQLNRYIRQKGYVGPDTVDNNWSTGTPTLNMAERTSYDENGNILTYVRHGNTTVGPLAMDSLNYHYYKHTNQLAQVNDAVPAGNYLNDIDNETSKYNYKYNAIGQLAKDSAGGLDTIKWTVYGKVKKIIKTNGDSIVFEYDPLGNRLEKRNFTHHDSVTDTTLYARDAQGNILAIYNRKQDSIKLSEFDIYGSKRIGVIDTNLLTGAQSISCSCSPISNPFDSSRIGYLEGQRRYELTNHLGNVLSILDDRKLPIDTSGTPNVADYYNANSISAQDYYPFGMVQPGRQFAILGDSAYRFGFNGKLHDDDIYGKDNAYDYGMRMYDPRLGRFMSIDPMASSFAWWTPYQFAGDKPISATDLDGAEPDDANKGSTLPSNVVPFITPLDGPQSDANFVGPPAPDKEAPPASPNVYFVDVNTKPTTNASYSADAYVQNGSTIKGPFTSNTYPEPSEAAKGARTANEGTHAYNNKTGHTGVVMGRIKGLNLVDDAGNRNTPGTNQQGGAVTMTDVDVHSGFSPTCNGSNGCMTIYPSQAEDFFSNFDWSGPNLTGNSSGTVTITRVSKADQVQIRNQVEDYQNRQAEHIPVGFSSDITGAPIK